MLTDELLYQISVPLQKVEKIQTKPTTCPIVSNSGWKRPASGSAAEPLVLSFNQFAASRVSRFAGKTYPNLCSQDEEFVCRLTAGPSSQTFTKRDIHEAVRPCDGNSPEVADKSERSHDARTIIDTCIQSAASEREQQSRNHEG